MATNLFEPNSQIGYRSYATVMNYSVKGLQGKYLCEDLKRTKIYGHIRDWERASKTSRKILKPEI